MGQKEFEEVLPHARTRATKEFGGRKWERPQAILVLKGELDTRGKAEATVILVKRMNK